MELNNIMEGASASNEKRNAEMKKSQGNRPGKFQADSLSQIKSLPGVKVIKKKR